MPLRTFRQIFLPYCLKQDDDGLWSVLNREYVPLVGYRCDFKGLGPAGIAKLAHHIKGKSIWLYDDGCCPDRSTKDWDAYQDRLKQLTKFVLRDGKKLTPIKEPFFLRHDDVETV